MTITIQTTAGTFIVPDEKYTDLVFWLQHNAVRVGGTSVSEANTSEDKSQRLLFEDWN
jgi:hypothetical protein